MRTIGGSFLAVLAGWAAGALCFLLYAPFAFCYMAPIVLTAWLLFFLPHYGLLPHRHWLWTPVICEIYGALWGVGLCLWYLRQSWLGGEHNMEPWFLIAAAVTGAVACCVARCNRLRYRAGGY